MEIIIRWNTSEDKFVLTLRMMLYLLLHRPRKYCLQSDIASLRCTKVEK